MQGGTFHRAFMSASLGSLVASGFGKLAGDWGNAPNLVIKIFLNFNLLIINANKILI